MDDLVTARLVLHPLSVREAERVAANEPADEDRWAPGYPAEGDVAGARGFLNICLTAGDPQPLGAYEIRRREDGRAIGGLGFRDIQNPAGQGGQGGQGGQATIGYGLIPAARGKGYATEALRALLAFARSHGLTRVDGDADLENVASQRVMTAAGMLLCAENAELKHYKIVWPETE